MHFVADNTVYVEGVGDVCSFATFDISRHGNAKYGSPVHTVDKAARSKQVRECFMQTCMHCFCACDAQSSCFQALVAASDSGAL